MGKHGIGKQNEKLVELCKLNSLVVTGTMFPHKPRHKSQGYHQMEKQKTRSTMYLSESNIKRHV
jgi:hypothetical protein